MARRTATGGALVAAVAAAAVLLQGCGIGGGAETTTTTSTTTASTTITTISPNGTTSTTTTTMGPLPDTAHCLVRADGDGCAQCEEHFELRDGSCLFRCQSDLEDFEIVAPEKKGLCLDDTTFNTCSDWIPHRWPNTATQMTSLRLFSAWQGFWPDEGREDAWNNLARFIRKSGARVLLGTQITCNETDDDRDWANVKKLIQLIGAEHIMGVGFGNEMELLWAKDYIQADATCLTRIWQEGYFWRKTLQRAVDLDLLGPSYQKIPLTSVFGAYALDGNPFVERSDAMVNSYLTNATSVFGTRWAFTLNIYPYFDPSNHLDLGSDHTCEESLKWDTCFDDAQCNIIGTIRVQRMKQQQLTGRRDDTLWIGETGWSFPQASTLNTPVAHCPKFSSRQSFETYYRNFLRWDLTLPDMKGPDHVFFFTIRDSVNFGLEEHFGLVGNCLDNDCKLRSEDYTTTSMTTTSTSTSTSTSTTTSSTSTPTSSSSSSTTTSTSSTTSSTTTLTSSTTSSTTTSTSSTTSSTSTSTSSTTSSTTTSTSSTTSSTSTSTSSTTSSTTTSTSSTTSSTTTTTSTATAQSSPAESSSSTSTAAPETSSSSEVVQITV